MPEYLEEKQLVSAIRARFPTEAALTDHWFVQRGEDMAELIDMPHRWVEAFADRTGDAVIARDTASIQAHTKFLAERYREGTKPVREILDVAYAENMMWKASTADKVWAWKFIATEIQQLYEAMWGSPNA